MQRTPAPPVPRPASFTCSRGDDRGDQDDDRDDRGDRDDDQILMIKMIAMVKRMILKVMIIINCITFNFSSIITLSLCNIVPLTLPYMSRFWPLVDIGLCEPRFSIHQSLGAWSYGITLYVALCIAINRFFMTVFLSHLIKIFCKVQS